MNNLSQNLENLMTDIKNELNLWSVQAQKIQSSHYSQKLESSLTSSQFQLQITLKSITNPLLNSGYIFLFEEDQVITPFISGNTLNYFYNSFFSYEDMSLAEFTEHFTYEYYEKEFLPNVEITRNKVVQHSPVFIQSIPNDPHQKPNGIIIFTLDTNYVDTLLNDSIPNGGSISLIYQSKDGGEPFLISHASASEKGGPPQDQILTEFSDLSQNVISYQNLNGHEYCVYKKAVGSDGLYAVLFQPSETAMESTRSFTWILLVEGIAIVIILSLFAFGYTKHSVSAMRSIVNIFSSVDLDESANIKDVFTYIQRAANKTLRQNEMLHLHLKKQRIIMEEVFLRKLISGDFLYESDVIHEQEELEFLIHYSRYLVLLCNFGDSRPPDLEKLADSKRAVRRALSEQFPDRLQTLNYDASSLVCVIGTDSDFETVKNKIDELFSTLNCPLPVSVYAGSPVYTLYDVAQSYKEARYLQNNLNSPDRVVWYQEIYKDASVFHFQSGLYAEQNILSQIMVGNTYEVDRILTNLFQGGTSGRESSPKALKCLSYELYRIASHIISSSQQSGKEENLLELNRQFDAVFLDNGNFNVYFSYIRTLFLQYSDGNKTSKKSKNEDLITKITSYIQDHYADPQLCIASIAQYCSISPKYLSQIFKEQKNENISSYIENLRIEKSCVLLQDKTLSVNQISEAVGYTNVHTFRIAFKRCKFVTPKEFRDNIAPK